MCRPIDQHLADLADFLRRVALAEHGLYGGVHRGLIAGERRELAHDVVLGDHSCGRR